MKDDIKDNTYLLPYTTVEIAMCHYGLGDRHRAVELLHDARYLNTFIIIIFFFITFY